MKARSMQRMAALGLMLVTPMFMGMGRSKPKPQPQPAPTSIPTPGPTPSIPVAGYHMIWEDTFRGTELNPKNWNAWKRPLESAYDDPANVIVNDGLTILTSTESDGLHHTGFLSSYGLFDANLGYFEARINFHDSPGEWCAFWVESDGIIPAQNGVNGEEIDVVEHLPGEQSSYPVHVHNWYSHDSTPQGQGHEAVGGYASIADGAMPLEDHFHTYGVLWTKSGYTFYLDGVKQWKTSSYASNDRKYILLTCEVNDGSWAGSIPYGGYGNRSKSVTQMKVDWVRVWQKN